VELVPFPVEGILMKLSRMTLSFLFVAAWFVLLVRFRDLFRSHRLVLALMVYLFLFVANRWHHWLRRLRPDEDMIKLNLDSPVNYG